MVKEDIPRSLALAVIKKTGLTLSEFRCDQNFVAGEIQDIAKNRQLLVILEVSVYIPCRDGVR